MRLFNYLFAFTILCILASCSDSVKYKIPEVPKIDQNYYQYVLTSLDERIMEDPENAHAYFRKADILLEQGAANEALNAIQKAIELDGQNSNYRLTRARANLLKGKYRQAFQEAQEASQNGLHSVELYETLAEASLQSNYFHEALLYSDSALALAPGNYQNYLRKGVALAASKDTASAEHILLESIPLGAPSEEVYSELVNLYTNSGNFTKARVYMEKSLSGGKEPEDNMKLLQARILRHTGNEDSARSILYMIKDSRTIDQIAVFNELKEWYLQTRKYDSVTFYANKILELEPQNKEPMLTLARVYDKRRSYQSAIKMYEQIAEMDSLYQEDLHKIAVEELAYLKRKVAYLWKKQQEEELLELKKGIAPMQTLAPGSPE